MSSDCCPTKSIRVDVQEDGWIRLDDPASPFHGWIVGSLTKDFNYEYFDLGTLKDFQLKVQRILNKLFEDPLEDAGISTETLQQHLKRATKLNFNEFVFGNPVCTTLDPELLKFEVLGTNLPTFQAQNLYTQLAFIGHWIPARKYRLRVCRQGSLENLVFNGNTYSFDLETLEYSFVVTKPVKTPQTPKEVENICQIFQ